MSNAIICGQSSQNLKPSLAIADQVDIIDNAYEPIIIVEIKHYKIIYCVDHIPDWSANVILEHE